MTAETAVWADTRYSRQEAMPQLGTGGQEKLAGASMVSIGADA
ncbi:hypothetical protein [Streptosporangium canum]